MFSASIFSVFHVHVLCDTTETIGGSRFDVTDLISSTYVVVPFFSVNFLYLLLLDFGILPSTALPIFSGTSELPSQPPHAPRHLRSLLRSSTVIAGPLLHTQLKYKRSSLTTRAFC